MADLVRLLGTERDPSVAGEPQRDNVNEAARSRL